MGPPKCGRDRAPEIAGKGWVAHSDPGPEAEPEAEAEPEPEPEAEPEPESDGQPVDLPDASEVARADGAGSGDRGPALGGPESTGGPQVGPGDPEGSDDGGFTLEQEASVEDRFGMARLFARVEEPGVPWGIAVGDDAVYVSTDNAAGRGPSSASSVLRYSPEGDPDGQLRLEGQDDTRLRGVPGLAVDHDGRLLAAESSTGRILRVDVPGSEQETHVALPDLPPCALPVTSSPCEPGAVSREPQPIGATVAGDGSLFVTDRAQATIWRLTPDGEPDAWHQDPGYRLGLPAEGGLAGLALDRDGGLLVLLGSTMADASAGEGVLFRIEVEGDGTAGRREELLRTEPGDDPADVVAGESGRIYVTLAGSDELLVLGADGSEEERFAAGDVEDGAGMPLDGPAGLAFLDEALLVANSAVDGEEDHWAVIEISVEDVAANAGGGASR